MSPCPASRSCTQWPLFPFHLQGIDVEVLRGFPAQNNSHLVLGKVRREGDGYLSIKLCAVDVNCIDQVLVRVGDEVFFRDFNHGIKSILRHHNVVQAECDDSQTELISCVGQYKISKGELNKCISNVFVGCGASYNDTDRNF